MILENLEKLFREKVRKERNKLNLFIYFFSE